MERPHWEYGYDEVMRALPRGGRDERRGVIGLGVGEQHAAAYAAHPTVRARRAVRHRRGAAARGRRAPTPARGTTTRRRGAAGRPGLDVVSIASYDSTTTRAGDARARARQARVRGEAALPDRGAGARDRTRCSPSGPTLRLSSNLPAARVAALPSCSSAGSTTGASGGSTTWRATTTTAASGSSPRAGAATSRATRSCSAATIHMIDLLLWLTRRPAGAGSGHREPARHRGHEVPLRRPGGRAARARERRAR